MTIPSISTDADAFLRSHLWGLLSTSRRSGAPQVSMVAYDWNGDDLVISCRSTAAKFINAQRQPHVVFSVPDGVDNLTVSGEATCLSTGPDRDHQTERLRDRLRQGAPWAAKILDADIAQGLDTIDRAVIVIEPDSVELLRPLG